MSGRDAKRAVPRGRGTGTWIGSGAAVACVPGAAGRVTAAVPPAQRQTAQPEHKLKRYQVRHNPFRDGEPAHIGIVTFQLERRPHGTLWAMRLFLGIALERNASESLLQIRERFEPVARDLRWSQPESWHVTLQFLGQTREDQAGCLAEKLGAMRAARVPVRIAGLGFFERAGVFWAGVELTPELLALQQHVVAATRRCGFVPEDRAYSPHITLARAKGRTGIRALAPVKAAVERSRIALSAAFTAEEFLLYESFPGPEGSRYEVRGCYPLGTAP
jgi:RNA 2',3'-cyclic 3'-phosphodiesterase